jgi:hypothetical protein
MDNRKLTREQTFIKKETKKRYPQKYTTGETLGYPGE